MWHQSEDWRMLGVGWDVGVCCTLHAYGLRLLYILDPPAPDPFIPPGEMWDSSPCQALFWLLAAAATLCTHCLLSPEWRGASSSASPSFSFLSPSAGRLSYCSVYDTLILELISCCFLPVSFSLSWKSTIILIVNPCVQSSTSAEIIQAPGRDFFL